MLKIFLPLSERRARKSAAFGFTALLLLSATPAYCADPLSPTGAVTVKDFLLARQNNQEGCSDEVGSAVLAKIGFGTGEICIASPNYAKSVPGWLGAHPETFAMTTNDGIYTALKALYPC